MRLNELLITARRAQNLTQKEVADHFGYASAQFVSNWERGASKPPLSNCKRLCDLLKISKKEMREALINCYADEVNEYIK